MRAIGFITLVAALAPGLVGCAKDPCAGAGGVCIAVEVGGNVNGIDQLSIGVDTLMRTVLTPSAPSSITLPVKVGIVLPAGTTGTVNVSIEGLTRGTPVAFAGPQAVTVPTHATVVFTLVGGAPPDDLSANAVDMAAPDLSTVTSNGMLMISPTSGSFATTARGASTTATRFTVTNIGGMTIAPGAPSIAGAQARSFAQTSTCDATTMLAAGANCTVDVTFSPLIVGSNVASLGIGGLSVTLSGTGTSGWTHETSTLSGAITSLWASGPTDVWAGSSGQVWHSTGDGTWTARNTGLPVAVGGGYIVLGGSSATDVHAVVYGTSKNVIWNPTAGQWVSGFTVGGNGPLLYSITSSSATDVFAAGEDIGPPTGAVWAYQGGSLARFITATNKDGGNLGGLSIRAISSPGPMEAWAVGSGATVLVYNSGSITWSDIEFSLSPEPSGNLLAVWTKSNTEAWIGGQSNYVAHIIGNTLVVENLHAATGGDLVGISGRTSPMEIYAVSGDANTVFRSTGANDWTAIAIPAIGNPQSLWVLSDGEVYVGGNGAIDHYQ